MTSKEKAIELIDKMNGKEVGLKEWLSASKYAKEDLKRKAYIVADEILDLDCVDMSEEAFNKHINYWKAVKIEMLKL